MKINLLLLFLMFKLVLFGQNYYDFIKLNNGSTIQCHITLINDVNIFYDIKGKRNKIENRYISLTKVDGYTIHSENKPDTIADETIKDKNDSDKILYVNPEELYFAGEELKNFSRIYYNGVTITGIGSVITVIGGLIPVIEVIVIGGCTSFIGSIVMIISHYKIGKAGDLVMSYSQKLNKKYYKETN